MFDELEYTKDPTSSDDTYMEEIIPIQRDNPAKEGLKVRMLKKIWLVKKDEEKNYVLRCKILILRVLNKGLRTKSLRDAEIMHLNQLQEGLIKSISHLIFFRSFLLPWNLICGQMHKKETLWNFQHLSQIQHTDVKDAL